MQMRPPSIYLAQSIRIKDGSDEEATVGVSGVEIAVSSSLLLIHFGEFMTISETIESIKYLVNTFYERTFDRLIVKTLHYSEDHGSTNVQYSYRYLTYEI